MSTSITSLETSRQTLFHRYHMIPRGGTWYHGAMYRKGLDQDARLGNERAKPCKESKY